MLALLSDEAKRGRFAYAMQPPAHFHRVARSLRIKSGYARRYRQSGSDRLEKQPTDPAAAGRNIHVFRGQDIITRVRASIQKPLDLLQAINQSFAATT